MTSLLDLITEVIETNMTSLLDLITEASETNVTSLLDEFNSQFDWLGIWFPSRTEKNYFWKLKEHNYYKHRFWISNVTHVLGVT